MLEDPFIIQNLQRIKDIYGIEENNLAEFKHNYHLQ